MQETGKIPTFQRF